MGDYSGRDGGYEQSGAFDHVEQQHLYDRDPELPVIGNQRRTLFGVENAPSIKGEDIRQTAGTIESLFSKQLDLNLDNLGTQTT